VGVPEPRVPAPLVVKGDWTARVTAPKKVAQRVSRTTLPEHARILLGLRVSQIDIDWNPREQSSDIVLVRFQNADGCPAWDIHGKE
jgi:hypothetical protein